MERDQTLRYGADKSEALFLRAPWTVHALRRCRSVCVSYHRLQTMRLNPPGEKRNRSAGVLLARQEIRRFNARTPVEQGYPTRRLSHVEFDVACSGSGSMLQRVRCSNCLYFAGQPSSGRHHPGAAHCAARSVLHRDTRGPVGSEAAGPEAADSPDDGVHEAEEPAAAPVQARAETPTRPHKDDSLLDHVLRGHPRFCGSKQLVSYKGQDTQPFSG